MHGETWPQFFDEVFRRIFQLQKLFFRDRQQIIEARSKGWN
jgi:hypothetical protein